MRGQTMLTNALSIDLEEWFHAELVRSRVLEAAPSRRVEWAVEPLLALLDHYDVKATFFVVGDIVRHQPALIQRVYGAGHEIGCHGWSHRPLWSLDPGRFEAELREFDREIAAIVPITEIVGFRAPTFSLDQRTSWAVDVLRKTGYRYDSSLFPVRNYMYGVDHCPPGPFRPTASELTIDHPQGDLVEFPMSAYYPGGYRPDALIKMPVSGGFYLRAMPLFVEKWMLRRVNAQEHPFVIYFHPWEADRGTPRVKGLSWLQRRITYMNAGSALGKLEALLEAFQFAPLRDVLGIRGGRLGREA